MMVIADGDVEYLHWLKTRLYSENRLTGDNMRDMAQQLDTILDRMVPIKLEDLK